MQKLEHTCPLCLEKWKGSHPPSPSSPQVLPASEREMEGEQKDRVCGGGISVISTIVINSGAFLLPHTFLRWLFRASAIAVSSS